MNLRALTDPGLIQIHAPFSTRDEAIAALAGLLAAHGKLHDHTAFVNEVMQREALGPTALGEGLAVPHGKCAAVREAAFAVATLREPVAWQGVEAMNRYGSFFCWLSPRRKGAPRISSC